MTTDDILRLAAEVERRMNEPADYHISDPAWRTAPRSERDAAFSKFYEKPAFILKGKNAFTIKGGKAIPKNDDKRLIHIDECVLDDQGKLMLVVETIEDGKAVSTEHFRVEELLEENDRNRHFWRKRTLLDVDLALENTLEHYDRLDRAQRQLEIRSDQTVGQVEQAFRECFNASIRLFGSDMKRAFSDVKLTSLGAADEASLIVRGVDQVGDVIARMHDTLGITARIADSRDWEFVPDLIALYMVADKKPREEYKDLKELKLSWWQDVSDFSEGLAAVQDENGKWGFIDENGNVVIHCQWYYAVPFSDGMALVIDEEHRGGFIDKNGNIVVPCQWEEAYPFSEGLAAVQNGNYEWGFIDKSGKVVIPCQWEGVQSFSEGLAAVAGKNGKCGFIDKEGRIAIPCQWDEVWNFFDNGLAPVRDKNGKWGFIDKSGALVILCQWEGVAWQFDYGILIRDTNNKWGFIDKNGEVVCPCVWQRLRPFSESLAAVSDENGKWGFIDKSGTLVIPCQWEEVEDFSEGLAAVLGENGKRGFVNKHGTLVIP